MKNVLPFQDKLPLLGERCYVAPTATVIGDVVLGDDASVWFGCVLRGDVGFIRVGKRTNIQDLTVVHVTGGGADTVIGDDVTIGHRAIIHGCTVGDGCLIGMGAILLDGCVIGEGSVVGAGSVVTPGTQIPPRSMVFGAPGRVARPLREHELEMGKLGGLAYLELSKIYRGEAS